VTYEEAELYLQGLELVRIESINPIFWQAFQQAGDRYILSLEGYFHLLEHDELQEARKSSRDALRVAKAAIVISGGLALVSVYLQLSSAFNFWPNA